MKDPWRPIATVPLNEVVETRKFGKLTFSGVIWVAENGDILMCDGPTHWRPVRP